MQPLDFPPNPPGLGQSKTNNSHHGQDSRLTRSAATSLMQTRHTKGTDRGHPVASVRPKSTGNRPKRKTPQTSRHRHAHPQAKKRQSSTRYTTFRRKPLTKFGPTRRAASPSNPAGVTSTSWYSLKATAQPSSSSQ